MVRISNIIRAKFAEGDNKRDAGFETPKEILRYDDISYGTELPWQVLDVYEKLKSRNILCEYHDYSSRKMEKPGYVFHLNIRSEDARKCNDEECRFFRSVLDLERKKLLSDGK